MTVTTTEYQMVRKKVRTWTGTRKVMPSGETSTSPPKTFM